MTLLIFTTLFNAFGAAFNMAIGERKLALVNAACAALCLIVIVADLVITP